MSFTLVCRNQNTKCCHCIWLIRACLFQSNLTYSSPFSFIAQGLATSVTLAFAHIVPIFECCSLWFLSQASQPSWDANLSPESSCPSLLPQSGASPLGVLGPLVLYWCHCCCSCHSPNGWGVVVGVSGDNSRRAESFILHLWLLQSTAMLRHVVYDEHLWAFMDSDGSPLLRPLLSPPCCAAMRKEIPDCALGNPTDLQAPLGHPEMPFSLSRWLLQQRWHLTLPFRVICSDFGNKRFPKEVSGLGLMPGRAAQTLRADPQAWAEPVSSESLSLITSLSSPCSALLLARSCAEQKREDASASPGP